MKNFSSSFFFFFFFYISLTSPEFPSTRSLSLNLLPPPPSAPWCGHCKQLAPDYERLPQLLASKHGNPDARVAAVDCDVHKQVCSKQGVQGFPTLKFFRGGSSSSSGGEDYRGPRDADSLAAFIAERAPKRPAEVVELTSNDLLQESAPRRATAMGTSPPTRPLPYRSSASSRSSRTCETLRRRNERPTSRS